MMIRTRMEALEPKRGIERKSSLWHSEAIAGFLLGWDLLENEASVHSFRHNHARETAITCRADWSRNCDRTLGQFRTAFFRPATRWVASSIRGQGDGRWVPSFYNQLQA